MNRPRHEVALLDTSVVIDFDPSLVGRYTGAGAVATMTLAELSNGLYTADPIENARREAHYYWVTAHFEPIGSDERAARTFGAVRQAVRTAGRNPRPRAFDLLIAAVALANGLALITRNEAVFRGLPAALTVVGI